MHRATNFPGVPGLGEAPAQLSCLPGRDKVEELLVPLLRANVHQIHAGSVRNIHGRHLAEEQRGAQGADQRQGRRCVQAALRDEAPEVVAGKALLGCGARPFGHFERSSGQVSQLLATRCRARIHPDGRRLLGEGPRGPELRGRRLAAGRREAAQGIHAGRGPIDAGVLLPASAHGGHAAEWATQRLQPVQRQLQRLHPHERGRGDAARRRGVAVAAVLRGVVRQVRVEVHAAAAHDG
mmetsp:Transcript_39323/g.112747  ORF Transcript_39323/g.112747 Transcript_39323/m.112747 type:complete len:238 (-) Transcript_39323:185-898(-)